uniref:Clu domain-containing protein n=1 Tax=Rhabditophanes sp. KR3021 TaxID=114890 RepID=A0AC35TFP8_9BILA
MECHIKERPSNYMVQHETPGKGVANSPATPESVQSSTPDSAQSPAKSTPENGCGDSCGHEHDAHQHEGEGCCGDEDVCEMEAPLITVTIQLPNGNSWPMKIAASESCLELTTLLQEREDSCALSCYSFYVNGVKLDSFTEIEKLVKVNDGDVIYVKEGQYSVRDARVHLRIISDLVKSNNLYGPTAANIQQEGPFPNYLGAMPTEEYLESVKSIQVSHDVTRTASREVNLSGIIPDTTKNVFTAYKYIGISPYNPPLPPRKLKGDCLYVDLETLENRFVGITCSRNGWFVNMSTEATFNPEISSNVQVYHGLNDLLATISPAFKKVWPVITKAKSDKHVFERLPSAYPVNLWVSKPSQPTKDYFKAEDETQVHKCGFEEVLPGGTRDWNEEFQSAKELPCKTFHDRINRDRVFFKIHGDYVQCATKGAMAVIDGNLPSLNAADEFKAQMFLWNNIFFSLAYDVKDHYKALGGNKAAHVITNNDLKGAKYYHELDKQKLYHLGLCIVDYKGFRVVCQSVVPGILDRDQDAAVVYGTIDFGKKINSDAEYCKILEETASSGINLPHKIIVQEEDGTEVEKQFYTSVETKGLVGNDSRKYLLDLFRSFPPDPNYIEGAYVTDKLASYGFPKKCAHKIPSLRAEFIELFTDLTTEEFVVTLNNSIKESPVLSTFKYEGNIVEAVISGFDLKDEAANAESKKLHFEALEKVVSMDEGRLDLRFNADLYYEGIKFAGSPQFIAKQKKLTARAAEVLVLKMIPTFVKECLPSTSVSMIDGYTLTSTMHSKGINMRYLGFIGTVMTSLDPQCPVLTVIVGEIVLRCAKHLFRDFASELNRMSYGAGIVHFMNCLFGVVESDAVKKVAKKKKGKKVAASSGESDGNKWKELTTADVWKFIGQDSKDHFDWGVFYESMDHFLEQIKAPKHVLLRRFCKIVGVQLTAKSFNLEKKGALFVEGDVYNLVPLIKHIDPYARDAGQMRKIGEQRFIHGQLKEAENCITEAVQYMNYIYGSLHPDMANSLKLLAKLHYLTNNHEEAYESMQKSIMITEKVTSIDHVHLVSDYINLALYAFACKKVFVPIQYLLRARYLAILIYGELHPVVATIDGNLALIHYHNGDYENCIKYFENFVDISNLYKYPYDQRNALVYRSCINAYIARGDFRSAIKIEKKVYAIYCKFFGEKHEKTGESSANLKMITEKAVEFQKKMNEFSSGVKGDKNTSVIHLGKMIEDIFRPSHWQSMLEVLNTHNGLLFLSLDEIKKLNTEMATKVDKSPQMTSIEKSAEIELD